MFKNLNTQGLGISGHQSEVIELALSHGFRGIDLDLGEFIEQVQLHGLAHARRLIDSAKLRIGVVRLPVAWQNGEDEYRRDMKRLGELLETAAAVGATRCVTTVLPASDQRPYHENFEFHRRRLAQIAEALAPFKMCLGLEFLAAAELRKARAFQFIHAFDALVTLTRMIGVANIGVVVDLWQIYAGGGNLEQVRGVSSPIVAVYLADAPTGVDPASLDEASRLLPGETGVIDSVAALTALAERGYDGPVTPLPHRSRFSGQGRDKIAKLASAALDQAWKAAGLNAAGKLAPAAKK